MDYYGNNDWRDYLAHYGVKGMKWRKHKYADNGINNTGRHLEYNGRTIFTYGRQTSGGRLGSESSRYISNGKHNLWLNKERKRTGSTKYSASTSIGATKGGTKTKRIGNIKFTRDEDGSRVEYVSRRRRKRTKNKVKSIISRLSRK